MLPPRSPHNSRLKTMSLGEKQFAQYLDNKGIKWIFLPCALDTGIPRRKHSGNTVYTPDFYCPEIDAYYEVSATRQAKEQSAKKIEAVLNVNPGLRIKIVHPNGELYNSLSYDKTKYATAEDLSLIFKYPTPTIFKLLRKKKVDCLRLRNRHIVFNKIIAIKEIRNYVKNNKVYRVNGKKIKTFRLKHKITAASLSPLLGIHIVQIYQYEAGVRMATTNKELFGKLNNLESLIKTKINILKHKPGKNNRSFESYQK